MTAPLLDVRSVTKDFSGDNGSLRALDRVSFQLERNSFVCVVGPSGSGKSTLLRLAGGLLEPSEGHVLFEGKPLAGPLRRIGFVFQHANLMPWRSAYDNVALPLEVSGDTYGAQNGAAGEMLKLVGLEGFERALPRDLSGGMAQRVALARALVHQPELLLLDEPFGSLDALTRERMAFELLRIWREQEVTVLMVTHSIPESALLADRVLVLGPRPGTLRLDLPVDLPRPRELAMSHTPEFGRLTDQIRAAIELA